MRNLLAVAVALVVGCDSGTPPTPPDDEPPPAQKPDAAPIADWKPLRLIFENRCNVDVRIALFDFQAALIWKGTTLCPLCITATDITCVEGDLICYGAETVTGDYTWGAGIDGKAPPCSNCCVRCGAAAVAAPRQLDCAR